ncbi:hypothetical protein PoB_006285000 [Plakobranchus ocellatus]|uniref:Uncharacterized protein n=1 Tax=Plakobranchus ocellatus TaxID=259542 RepID=A0AAV4CWW5_9GAST|nr:hypothetical protein PoB_006285000 [Plakobranchus ocellatus]
MVQSFITTDTALHLATADQRQVWPQTLKLEPYTRTAQHLDLTYASSFLQEYAGFTKALPMDSVLAGSLQISLSYCPFSHSVFIPVPGLLRPPCSPLPLWDSFKGVGGAVRL